MSIAIIIPSATTWESAFGRSLTNLVGQLGYHQVPHMTYNVEGSILVQSREKLFELASKHQYALCLDSDMTFPMDIVPRLMRHEKPIVVANYVTRKPCRFVCQDMNGDIMNSKNKTGIEQASRVAIGCALVEMKYILELPKPWFNFPWNPETQNHIGEDYYFSDLCKANGVEMWVDHDLSQEVKHIKTVQLGVDDVA